MHEEYNIIVGGGNKQRSYVSKQEASSPTSHTESVFCAIGIEAEEERDVAVTDIIIIIKVIRPRAPSMHQK